MSRGKKYLGAFAKTRLQFFFSPFAYFEKGPMKLGVMNDIYITKLLKPTNFNFPEWQTESSIPSKIINEILICVL